MLKKITRRQFLKLGGQALVATGAAGVVSGLGSPRRAAAATTVELDGREMVARVGNTFATIQLVPSFSKSSAPEVIQAKVQYSTDVGFATYTETATVVADYYVRSEKGRHVGPDGSSSLIVSRKHAFVSWRWEIEPGDVIVNVTDNSTMVVSQVVDDRTIAGELSGGTNNVWNGGDKWRLDRTYYRLEMNLTGLQASTKNYYRVLLRYEGDPWPTPRPAHSFRTRRPAGQTFRFAIWADPHRSIRPDKLYKKYWQEWDQLIAALKNEQVDFVVDVGDTWPVCDGKGNPMTKFWPELYSNFMRPARNGYQTYRGVSDVCADCGYYMARGNHEGISDYDKTHKGRMLRDLLRLFVPNPTGNTYPQGGSTDPDYNQGYFAVEWGDALFIVLDVVKYKDKKTVDPEPTRFHIGEAQLAWLTSVLQNSQRRWKFIFAHHLFGGGGVYGRGGVMFALENEQAQIQALAEQYGAQAFFYGHDHLLAEGWANGVLYYCCGLAWGSQSDYTGRHTGDNIEIYYPDGYTSTSCKSEPPACENNGYCIVEVTPTQVTIQYKTYLGAVLLTTVLT